MIKLSNKIIGVRIAAILETAIYIALILIIAKLIGNDDRFFYLAPHPFWIIIILVSAQYGVKEGIITVLFCSIALLAGNIPPQTLEQTTYTYWLFIILKPSMWFASAMILGLLRDKHIITRETLTKKIAESVHREAFITEAYTDLRHIKEMLEKKLSSQLTSIATAYQAINSTEALDEAQAIKNISTIVYQVMQPQKFSVFIHNNDYFKLFYSYNWQESDTFNTSFTKRTELYNYFLNNPNRPINVINDDDRKILAGEAILASALTEPNTDNVFAVLKIETLEFTELTVSTIETFQALCSWIRLSYGQAKEFNKAKENQFIDPANNIYTYNYFLHQAKFLLRLSASYGFNIYCLNLEVEVLKDNIKNIDLQQLLLKASKKTMPKDALLFNGINKNKYHILIRNLSVDNILNLCNQLEQLFLEYTHKLAKIKINYDDLLVWE